MKAGTRERVSAVAASAAFATWFLGGVLSQHPNRQFDRLRKFDRTGVAIPNWRFFAPEPATHDFRVLHRVLNRDGTQSHWQETHSIADRRTSQMFWFPERRRDKAMNDVCNEILRVLQVPGLDISRTPGYRLIRGVVAKKLEQEGLRPEGFQFLVVGDTGHDEEAETRFYFASKFERCDE